MPKATNRTVVADISKASFVAPSAGGGGNLPNLRTRPTNRLLGSFAGFSESLNQLSAVRERNDAAKEALKARNDALAGNFSVFDREQSVQVYDQTRGDIKGRSSALAIQLDLDAAKNDILNKNLTIDDTLLEYDQAKARIIQDKYQDHLEQTESYKSGFLPHVVSTIEKNRIDLASKHQEKFITQTKADQSELVSVLAEQSPDTGPDKGVDFQTFSVMRTAGVNMGLSREEATENTIDSIGLIAVGEGKPWLLKFADQAGPDGFKVNNNTRLRKKIFEYRTKAQAQFIQGEKRKIEIEAKELDSERLAIKQEAYQNIIENPGEDHSSLIRDIGDMQKLKGEDLAKLSNFAHTVRNGDRDISPDNQLLVKTKLKIATGELKTVAELVKLYTDSGLRREGINLAGFKELQGDLEKHQSSLGSINAFTANRDSIKNIFGDDQFLEENTAGFGKPKRAAAKEMQNFAIRSMDEALLYFQAQFPEETLSGPEASRFFTRVRKSIEINLKARGETVEHQKGLTDLGVSFLENGDLDSQSIEALKVDNATLLEKAKAAFGGADAPKPELPENVEKELRISDTDGHISLLETYNDARARQRFDLAASKQFLNSIKDYVNGRR